MTIVTNSAMMQEGNSGDLTPFEVCVMLTNIQSGLMRDLIFSLSVEFITSGIIINLAIIAKECLVTMQIRGDRERTMIRV